MSPVRVSVQEHGAAASTRLALLVDSEQPLDALVAQVYERVFRRPLPVLGRARLRVTSAGNGLLDDPSLLRSEDVLSIEAALLDGTGSAIATDSSLRSATRAIDAAATLQPTPPPGAAPAAAPATLRRGLSLGALATRSPQVSALLEPPAPAAAAVGAPSAVVAVSPAIDADDAAKTKRALTLHAHGGTLTFVGGRKGTPRGGAASQRARTIRAATARLSASRARGGAARGGGGAANGSTASRLQPQPPAFTTAMPAAASALAANTIHVSGAARTLAHWRVALHADPLTEAALGSAAGAASPHTRYVSFAHAIEVAPIPASQAVRLRFLSHTGGLGGGLGGGGGDDNQRHDRHHDLHEDEDEYGTRGDADQLEIHFNAAVSAAAATAAAAAAGAAAAANSGRLRGPAPGHAQPLAATGSHAGYVLCNARVHTPLWEVFSAPVPFRGRLLAVEHFERVPREAGPLLRPPRVNEHGTLQVFTRRRRVGRVALAPAAAASIAMPAPAAATAAAALDALPAEAAASALARTPLSRDANKENDDTLLPSVHYGGAGAAPQPPAAQQAASAASDAVTKLGDEASAWDHVFRRRVFREEGGHSFALSPAEARTFTLTYEPAHDRLARITLGVGQKLVIDRAVLHPVVMRHAAYSYAADTVLLVGTDVHADADAVLGPHARLQDGRWRQLLHHVWGRADDSVGAAQARRDAAEAAARLAGGLKRRRAGAAAAGSQRRRRRRLRRTRAPPPEDGTGAGGGVDHDGAPLPVSVALRTELVGPHTFTFYATSGAVSLHATVATLSRAELRLLLETEFARRGLTHVLDTSATLSKSLADWAQGSPAASTSPAAAAAARRATPVPPSPRGVGSPARTASPRARRLQLSSL